MNASFRLPADEYVKQPRARLNAYDILNRSHQTLELSDRDEDWFQQYVLNTWKLQTDWFVCVQNRTATYAPFDETTQSYRNCSIACYELAIVEIIRRGGTVFRIGHPDDDNLPDRPYLYDVRADFDSRLHLVLSARCRFFLGCSSGVSFLATAFGRPLALANMVPPTSLPYTKNDIALHKQIYSYDDDKILSFNESLALPIRAGFISSMYGDRYIPLENDAQQILAFVKLMLSDDRSKVFSALGFLEPEDYSYPCECGMYLPYNNGEFK